jgi:IS30 family transposase
MKNFQEKAKFKRPKEKRGRFNIGKKIRKRLIKVHKRTSKYCFVTLAERKSRQCLALQVPNIRKNSKRIKL